MSLFIRAEVQIARQTSQLHSIARATSSPAGSDRPALLQEGAERRDPGAGADHDDRGGGIGRQAELRRGVNEGADRLVPNGAVAQIGRRDAAAAPGPLFVAHRGDRQVNLPAHRLRRRGDRIEARQQRV
ncbi:MAG TPA: hypothetical protein VM755_18220 [Stellaceae bacterium]|nr:hypothetical protein [Stellaceae bacterium]